MAESSFWSGESSIVESLLVIWAKHWITRETVLLVLGDWSCADISKNVRVIKNNLS